MAARSGPRYQYRHGAIFGGLTVGASPERSGGRATRYPIRRRHFRLAFLSESPAVKSVPSHKSDPLGSGDSTRRRPHLLIVGAIGSLAALLVSLPALGAIGLTVPTASTASGYRILFSHDPHRRHAARLAGQTLRSSARLYVFLGGARNVRQVSWYIDDPAMSKLPWLVASRVPFDLNGTGRKGWAMPFDAGSLADVRHTLKAKITLSNGHSQVISTSFRVRPWGRPSYHSLVMDEQFRGSSVNTSRWSLYSGPNFRNYGSRDPSAVGVDGHGNLVITASTRDGQIVSGGLQTMRGLRYGHYEFRAMTEFDPVKDMSGVILLWPHDQVYSEGESDLYETLGTRRPIYVFLHHKVDDPTVQDYYRQPANASRWHTFAADWAPGSFTLYRDGVRFWRDTDLAAVPSTSHNFGIQFDTGSGRPLNRPVRMYVSYVRIFQ